MRMLRPSPGEAADRQTILHLKCKYGDLKRLNIKPFRNELEELQEYLERNWFIRLSEEDGRHYNELCVKMGDVNNQLWKLEDEKRLRIKQNTADLQREFDMSRSVTKLNDDRADLVNEINKLFMVVEQEKIYLAQ